MFIINSVVDVNKISADNWAPLHLACSKGHLEAVKELIFTGKANVNLIVPKYGTPLHCVAKTGRVKILSYLLIHNADPE